MDIKVCKIHNKSKSNCRLREDDEGSKTGSFCAELNDLLSRGRVELCLGTAKDDDNDESPSVLMTGDFWGDGNSKPSV